MEFRILGPLEIEVGGQRVPLGRAREQKILAALLLEANRLVSVDRLVDVVWDESPPQTSPKQIRNCVSSLRQRLAEAGAPAETIATEPAGYVLRLDTGQLDAQVFADRVEEARRLAAAGRPGEAAAALRSSLALWRGSALAGIGGRHAAATAVRLNEQRLAAIEELHAHELASGGGAELVAHLAELVGQHPLRERLRGQLMLALYRCGRRADALEVYREGRRLAVDELGLEPGAELRELERAILTDQVPPGTGSHPAPAPVPVAPPSAPSAPAQLPAEVSAFTGRAEHLSRLDALVGQPTGQRVVISAVAGTAGIGKTALAVHWAHRVRDRFPDGQLYVNLRGYAPGPPVRPIEALALFLRALGMSSERVPVDVDEAAAAYRSMLAGRRVLVVLDNAASPDQVRPLLPGSAGCVAVVTSRDRLSGLVARDGADLIALDVLSPGEAADLLARTVGSERVRAEPEAVGELARLCAYLPLALRIAAAHLAVRPRRRVAAYVGELATGNRLAALSIEGDGQTAVQAAFDLSYATLAPATRVVFRRLGLFPGADLTADAAAALAGAPAAETMPALDRLVAAHLVDECAEGRFTFHDLLRRYAADRAQAEDGEAECRTAHERLLDWYLATADAAAALVYPEILRRSGRSAPATGRFDDHAAALHWLDAERSNLVAIGTHAADHGQPRAAWLLADTLRGYFHLRMYTVDWLAVARAGLVAAELDGDRAGQASARLSLGDLHWRLSRYPQAVEHYAAAAALAREAGWSQGQAAVHGNLGNVYQQSGQLALAAEEYRQALAMAQQTGWALVEAANLDNLAAVYWELGRLADAAEHSQAALALLRRTGSRFAEAVDLTNLGEVRHAQGRLDDALSELERALVLHREVGNRGGEAETLRLLAAVRRDSGRLDEGAELARAALSLARDSGDRRYEADAMNTLATFDRAHGRHAKAAEWHRQALELAREIGNRYPEAEALIGLADAVRRSGRLSQARRHADEALAVARQVGYRLLEGEALAVSAQIERDGGRAEAAARHAGQARAIRRETGHRPAGAALPDGEDAVVTA